jgi:hypothetical protein
LQRHPGRRIRLGPDPFPRSQPVVLFGVPPDKIERRNALGFMLTCMTIAIIVVIVLLVLLLTGSLGTVLIFSLQVIGWIVVALLVIGLVWNLLEIPLRALKSRRDEDETKQKIKYKRAHGYDTTALQEKLDSLSTEQPPDRFARRALKKRIKMGYHYCPVKRRVDSTGWG